VTNGSRGASNQRRNRPSIRGNDIRLLCSFNRTAHAGGNLAECRRQIAAHRPESAPSTMCDGQRSRNVAEKLNPAGAEGLLLGELVCSPWAAGSFCVDVAGKLFLKRSAAMVCWDIGPAAGGIALTRKASVSRNFSVGCRGPY